MGVQDTIAQRSAYVAQALGTMGADPEWDKRLTAYLTTECLAFADMEFGVMADALEKQARAKVDIEIDFGKNFAQHPEAVARFDEVQRETGNAEQARVTQYLKPYWDAASNLMHTPAPTLAAALFKSNMIFKEDLFCEAGVGPLAMGAVAADFHRLGLKEAV